MMQVESNLKKKEFIQEVPYDDQTLRHIKPMFYLEDSFKNRQ